MPLAVRLEVLVAAVLCMWGVPARCVCGLSCAVPAASKLRAAHVSRVLSCSGLAVERKSAALGTTRSFGLEAPLGLSCIHV